MEKPLKITSFILTFLMAYQNMILVLKKVKTINELQIWYYIRIWAQ